MEEQELDINHISSQTVNNIRRKINSYPRYYDFLLAVQAHKIVDGEIKVARYYMSDIWHYQADHVNHLLADNLSDTFVFTEVAEDKRKIKQAGGSKTKSTGYFIPRNFWDFIKKKDDTPQKNSDISPERWGEFKQEMKEMFPNHKWGSQK